MFELGPIRTSKKQESQGIPNIEIRANGSFIQWRYAGMLKWNTIIPVKDIQGAKGEKGQKGDRGPKGDKGVQGQQGQTGPAGPRGLKGESGKDGLDGLDGKKGKDGREIELQINGDYIQWRYKGDPLWKNLVKIDDIKGEKGDKGPRGERGERGERGLPGHHGSAGERGPQGPMGFTGPAGPQGDPGPNVTGGTSLPPSGDYLYELFYDTDDGIMYIWDGSAWQVVGSGAGGDSGYRLAEGPDYQDDYVYVGYEHESNGSWFIYRRTVATNVREYASGSSDFATNWTGREGLSYA